MQSARDTLLGLPFVGQRADGSLDYWCPPETISDEGYCWNSGRLWGAMWMSAIRQIGMAAPHVHLNRAMRSKFPACRRVAGLQFEIGEAIRHAPRFASPSIVCVAHLNFTGDLLSDFGKLPWIEGKNPWLPKVTGDPVQDRATGRHYGAAICKFIQQTGNSQILGLQGETPPEHEEIIVGMIHVIVETALAAPRGCTPFQASEGLLGLAGDRVPEPAEITFP